MLSAVELTKVFEAACDGKPNADNLRSIVTALIEFGPRFGLNKPHRVAKFGGQMIHESANFRYDREIWDGKGAQARYDTRTDLGNTPQRDGDGYKNRGRGPIQVTGGYNIGEFDEWVKSFYPNAPDFRKDPDLINTDPYEGLSAIWFWTTRNLNAHADDNNIERISRIINGGTNGLADRYADTDRMSLAILGYAGKDIRGFQRDHGLKADGQSGPKTRAALHATLLEKSW